MANTTTDPSTTTTTTTTTPPVTVTNQNYVTIAHSKPRSYNGEKPQDWIRNFEMIAVGNGWDKNRKLQNIPSLFIENARGRNWYRITFGMNPPTDFDDFCTKMISGLGPANQKFSSFQNMNDRKQGLNESSVDYYYSKLNLITEHDPGMDPEMKVNIIQNGLRTDVKKRVFGKCTNLDALFELLKNEDFLHKSDSSPIFYVANDSFAAPPPPYNNQRLNGSSFRGYRPRGQLYRPYISRNQFPNHNSYQNPSSNFHANNNTPYPNQFRFRGGPWPRSTPPRHTFFNQRNNYVTCYRCGIPGHISRECRVQVPRSGNYIPNYTAPVSAPPPPTSESLNK